MAKPSKLAHVVYMTGRFDEMLDWYGKVFEAEVQYRNPAFAFLTFDDEHHRFAFANMSVISREGAQGRGWGSRPTRKSVSPSRGSSGRCLPAP